MFLIELFVPRGALSQQQRQQAAERLATALVTEHDAAAETVASTRAMTQVLVHEADAWQAGTTPVTAADPPRYLVRASVPGAWRQELTEHVVQRCTRALADLDDNPDRLYREPHAWVVVVGVPQRGYGLYGAVQHTDDLVELLNEDYRAARAAGKTAEPPPGTSYDPHCGAAVPVGDPSFPTLEQDGTTYWFCCDDCRQGFIGSQREAAGAQ